MPDSTDAKPDAERLAFLAKRRAARKVKSRKRRASKASVRQEGAGGVQAAAGACADMDSPSSQNLHQKSLPHEALTPTSPIVSSYLSAGELPCLIYAKPLNPRLLLVQFDDNTRGKVVIRPVERALFGPGKRVWVKQVEKGIYVLAGRYNRFGARV